MVEECRAALPYFSFINCTFSLEISIRLASLNRCLRLERTVLCKYTSYRMSLEKKSNNCKSVITVFEITQALELAAVYPSDSTAVIRKT